jgi:integral membrane protein
MKAAHDPRFLKLLAALSVLQAASLVALLGVRCIAGYSAGVTVVGALHGVVWLLYIWVLLAMVSLKMWSKLETSRLVVCTLVPFGGFVTALWINNLSKK